MKRIFLLFIFFSLSVIGLCAYIFHPDSTTSASSSNQTYTLTSTSCWFDVNWRKTIRCYHLKTNTEFGEFLLPVVVIKSDSEDARPDAVLYLQGGPGTGAGLDQDGIERWLNWVELTDLRRDLILMDPRGTGKSLPKFNCDDKGAQIRSWKRNMTLAEEMKMNNEVMRKCFEQLAYSNKNLQLKNFGTVKSAEDILQLMTLLGYSEWNILAVSYGTRLALEVERQHQTKLSGLKSMVLDSVYPAGMGGVQTWPEVLNSAIINFLKGCSAQVDCAKARSRELLEKSLLASLKKLEKSPIKFNIMRWNTQLSVEFVLNDHRFVSIIFAATYDTRRWIAINEAIEAINSEKPYAIELHLKTLIEAYLNRNLQDNFNGLAFTAVDCADNHLGSAEDYLSRLDENPLMAPYARFQWRYQLCHQLPHQNPLISVNSDLPILLLSGRQDSVTPVEWAQKLHQKSINSQLIIRDKLAHSVLSTDLCLLQNLYRFFDEPKKKFDYCN